MICELCKLLNNPLKREILLKIYTAREAVNVGILADIMERRGLRLSGVSQYLKQLERLGLIRRERSGRYVNYSASPMNAAPDVRRVVEALVRRYKSGKHVAYDAVFCALMNPFRAKVMAMLMRAPLFTLSGVDICEKTDHMLQLLKRDLRPAIVAGLICVEGSENPCLIYHAVALSDPFVKLLVSFC